MRSVPSGSAGSRPVAAIVMGVSGSGKSVVGEALADLLGCRFIEGDRLHPPENVARMSGGLPLTDAHRAGWLDKIGTQVAASVTAGEGVVAACSALKIAYRDRLRAACPHLAFVFIDISPDLARTRVATRKGHFMPASLVDSQFADLQKPLAAENALALDARRPVGELAAEAAAFLTHAAAAPVS